MPTGSDEAKSEDSATRSPLSRGTKDEARADDSAIGGAPPRGTHDEARADDSAMRAPPDFAIYEERVKDWIAKFWKIETCPVCGFDQFARGNLYELHQADPAVLVSPQYVPVFMVACRRCGYSWLFNALEAGVLRPIDDSEQA